MNASRGPSLSYVAEGGLDRVLALARKHLDMDLSFVGEFAGDEQVLREVHGALGQVPLDVGMRAPLTDTYCRLMIAGEIPCAVPDTSAEPALRALPATEALGIGSYVGVPVRLSDGSLYGSLCCLSRQPKPVDRRDVGFLALLAELVVEQVEDERRTHAQRAKIEELLNHQRIAIALQPIVDLGTGRLLGVEALSRFADAGPPDAVFATARAAGLGEELERLAVRHAWKVLPMLPGDRYLAVNLSPDTAVCLAAQTTSTRLDRLEPLLARLVVEITEHAAVQSYDRLREALAPARERGLRIAIDDAGAGYASLHHVVELRPDLIKIDRSLIDGVSADATRRSVIKALVALANDIGASTVAEGVEHAADLAAARELGLQAAQGYLLARPSTDRGQVHGWLAESFPLPWAAVPRSRRG